MLSRCDFHDFNYLGHRASPTLARGKLFLTIRGEPPFCDASQAPPTES